MHFLTRHYRADRVATTLAAAIILVGAACATSAHAGIARPAAAAPTYGGSYSYRINATPDCLDPQKTASASSNLVDSYVFDTLLATNPKGQYVGDLATKYTVSKGGTRLLFDLRKNVDFSNGDPLTAQDVKFTFDRALNPATKSPATATDLAAVTATKVINKYTVEVDLKTPSRPLLTNLTIAYTGILDRKWFQAHPTDTCTAPVGSGAYKIRSTGGDFSDVVLVANSRHKFGPSWVKHRTVPYVTTVHIKTITSDATAISELLSGGVDFSGVSGTDLSRVKGNKSIVLHSVKSQNITFIEFNTKQPPFNSLQMRKAFAELINRPAIVKVALGGLGQAVYGPLAPGIPYYDKAAGKYMPKYNPKAAAKTISARHATGPYTYLTVGIPAYSTMAEIIQQAAGQAGMQLNIVPKSSVGDFLSDATKGNFNVLALGIGWPDPDVLYMLLHTSQGGGKGLNWTGVTSNRQLDELLQKGRTTLDRKQIGPIYDKAQVLINKQLDFIGVVAAGGYTGVRSRVKGYHVNSGGNIAIQDLYVKTK